LKTELTELGLVDVTCLVGSLVSIPAQSRPIYDCHEGMVGYSSSQPIFRSGCLVEQLVGSVESGHVI